MALSPVADAKTRYLGGAIIALLLATAAASPGRADPSQTTNGSDSGSVSGQFKSGAHQVGEGATHIGEGIKQGAVEVWEAVKAGANAAAAKFRSGSTAPASQPPANGSSESGH